MAEGAALLEYGPASHDIAGRLTRIRRVADRQKSIEGHSEAKRGDTYPEQQ
jgi:hypothetical protein